MLGKTILSVTAAAFIAAGTIGASTTAADAYHRPHGPGIFFGFGPFWGPGPYWGPYPYSYPYDCRLVPVKVKWYDKKGHKHWSTKWVRRCW